MGHLDHLLPKIIKVSSHITAVQQKARQLNHSILPSTAHFIFIFTKFQFNVISIKAEISQHTWIGSIGYHLFSCSVVFGSLQPHGPQHPRLPCPSPTPGAYSNSCPLSQWCHPTISSSVIPFSSCPQYFPASGSFPVSHFFAWGGQSIGASASASALPMNTQDWSPLGWTGWISLQSKGLSRVFSNTTVQKHQFFGAQLSL